MLKAPITQKSYYSFLLVFALFLPAQLLADKVKISCSQSDASIFVDGQKLGIGSVEIVVRKNSCVTVRVEKVGYLTIQKKFCDGKNYAPLPKTYYFELAEDDAYQSSVSTDQANNWVELKVGVDREELEAWKLISQIVTDYFDVIEVTDRETGYLRTAWEVQSFTANTIRTRVIIKLGGTSPLEYKAKLVSEYSGSANTSVKQDQLFREWDRVLRRYEDLLGQLQSRLSR